MSRKALIISIIAVVAVSVIVCGILLFVKGVPGSKPTTPDSSAPKPGDAVSVDKTPEYQTCELLSTDAIRDAFGDEVEGVEEGARAGIIAQNYEVADECRYSLSSSREEAFIAQVYLYTADPEHINANVFDGSWRNINRVTTPAYTLSYPAYFKSTEEGTKATFVMQVVVNTKHYRFAIEQSTSASTYNEKEALTILISLANKAKYAVTNTADAPPAPNV